ncbi:hypothetical protein O9929_13125 [Vibrio lentus]|nr:hypothetical protein [Vibrio lentus]
MIWPKLIRFWPFDGAASTSTWRGVSSTLSCSPTDSCRTYFGFMDDRQHGAVIEFNGIAAGMAPFDRKPQVHDYMHNQWPGLIGSRR